VVAPGKTSQVLASLLGDNFAWLGPESVGMTTLEARENQEKFIEDLVDVGKKVIEESKIDAIAFSCMSCGFQEVEVELQRKLGVPVINNVKAAVKMAELMVDLNIPHSKKFYKKPDDSLWPDYK
jgi:allantoin racemase